MSTKNKNTYRKQAQNKILQNSFWVLVIPLGIVYVLIAYNSPRNFIPTLTALFWTGTMFSYIGIITLRFLADEDKSIAKKIEAEARYNEEYLN